ncbi:MAG: hypothetical protein ABMB14_06400 [Myxococcota bacterium]
MLVLALVGSSLDGCAAIAVRRALWDRWFEGHAVLEQRRVRLEAAHDQAELHRLRTGAWPTDARVLGSTAGPPVGQIAIAVTPDGGFDLVDLGSDGRPGSRCGYADEQDLRWSARW